MTDIHAKIRAKGLEKTGVTERYADRMFNDIGGRYMAIVELKAEMPHGPNTEGKRAIDLVIENIEVAPTTSTDEYLRNLQRQFGYERRLEEEGPALLEPDGQAHPRTEDVLDAGGAFLPHPYVASTLSTDDSEHGPVCDHCGQIESAGVHHSDEQRDLLASARAELGADGDENAGAGDDDEGEEGPDPDDPAYEPHPFDGLPGYVCSVCDQDEGSAIHQKVAVPATT